MRARYTAEEKRAAILAYHQVPYGRKGAWLREQPFSRHQLTSWRSAYFEGDLDRGLIPRDTASMPSNPARLPHLEKLLAAREQEIQDLKDQHAAQIAQLREEAQAHRTVSEALGKAIGMMHTMSEHSSDPTPRTNAPSTFYSANTTSSTPSVPSPDTPCEEP
ncbi:hypothetical protein [Falsarthrobacter nasiphocae]|uniref:Transposase-like protein n=1 Tax=Falsarthrobacter nasiphocae TaxID=189863 RepID=A0AAE4C6I6_9MICC|nr:hypothetical protein [Falsarthrobacter nasiphocae]MDR6891519.1 transposase-like protein [Falsarthrobacter nasiphocae]MDR6891615.1 transposase-like protein [Falsarthrobacter nasiphocae]MDR6892212.1 transposase-like protein [Falsarthrobacter nasiphocae]MDR6892221.1 transposase-like protein [Falsarthrobacter nasiphocae]